MASLKVFWALVAFNAIVTMQGCGGSGASGGASDCPALTDAEIQRNGECTKAETIEETDKCSEKDCCEGCTKAGDTTVDGTSPATKCYWAGSSKVCTLLSLV